MTDTTQDLNASQELDFPRWLSEGSADPGLDYCPDCAEAARKDLNDPEAIVDGGWATDHDTPPQCESCGTPLAGNLLDSEYWGTDNIRTLGEWMQAIETANKKDADAEQATAPMAVF